MSNITDFISASVAEKPNAAFDSFSAAIEDKVAEKLADIEQEVRDNMFNKELNHV